MIAALRTFAGATASALLATLVACAPSIEPPAPGSPAGSPAATAVRPPRLVLLVTVDTLRADRLGFDGYRLPTSPFLDGLAREGAVFERAFASSSWTPPTMASIFTGTAPMTHGVVSGEIAENRVLRQPVLPESLETIAELLKRHGYRTVGVPSNRHLAADLGFAQGFDRYFDPSSFRLAAAVRQGVRDQLAAEFGPDWAVAARRERLFLWIHFFDPHDPYVPYGPWMSAQAPHADVRPRRSPARKVMRELRRMFPNPDAALAERIRPFYDSEVKRVDDELAAIWRELEPGDDSLVIFTADHGEEMAEHGSLGHSQSLYQELVHVPLFVRWPGVVAAGTRSVATVSSLDLLPTIAASVGEPVPDSDPNRPGRSLLPLARGERAEARPAFLELAPPKPFRWAVVDGDTKLIVDPTDGGRAELYDLARDPWETTNLATERPADVDRLRAALRERARALPRAPDQRTRDRVDENLRKELEALGYLGGEAESDGD